MLFLLANSVTGGGPEMPKMPGYIQVKKLKNNRIFFAKNPRQVSAPIFAQMRKPRGV